MPIPPIKDSVTIITGASAGIGRAAAGEFARAGAKVVLAARDASSLAELESELSRHSEALAVPADVTSDRDVLRLRDAALDRFGRIDILICNAGVGLPGAVESLPLEAVRQVFEVNYFGVLRCIQAALPTMIGQRRGLVQIVSSVIGRRAVPGHGAYCSTKFALYGLAESLRLELAPAGVAVQTVYPSLTDTGFQDNSLLVNPKPSPRRMRPMPAEEVARQMLRAARRGSRDHVVSLGGKMLTALSAIAPGLVDAILAQVMKGEVPDRR